LAHNKGVSQVSILRFVPQGRGESCSALALDRGQNLELKKIVEQNRIEAKIRAGSPYNFLMINDSPSCRAGTDRLTILPDSTIYPCDAFKQVKAEKIVGTDEFSRLDRWSLRECWEKSPYLRAIREYLKSPFEQPCCACEYLGRCLSGCIAQKYIANGNLKKAPDPMCLC
jgi:radical SAM protein with 4Fe4S-binding SPASM domain